MTGFVSDRVGLALRKIPIFASAASTTYLIEFEPFAGNMTANIRRRAGQCRYKHALRYLHTTGRTLIEVRFPQTGNKGLHRSSIH